MTFEELKAMDDTYVMHTYARFPVDIDHGQGATLYSLAGKEYIDFTSGIGVNSLGYGDPTWISAITQQIQKLGHISNLYYTQPGERTLHPHGHGQGVLWQLRCRGQRSHDQAGPEVQL